MADNKVVKEPIVPLDDTSANDRLSKSEEFVAKNKKVLSIATLVIAVIGGLFIFYKYYINNQDKEAQAEMFSAVYNFEADSLDKAIKGDGKDLGLLDISETYDQTKAGNLANFYLGVSYLKKGKFDDAITYLENFKSNDLLVQARAYCLLGDAYMEKKDLESAVENYKKAAEYKPNESFTPRYLMKLAYAYELQKDFDSAVKAYDEIIEKYYKAPEANDAKKYKAKAQALASN